MWPSSYSSRNKLLLIVVLVAIVFLSYTPVLKSQFLNWDDNVHLLKNLAVRGLDVEHLKMMFTETINQIYIPLTSLSFAIEHHFFGYDPFVYHLNNLLLHIAISGLIFIIGMRLGLGQVGAMIAALIFGVHPMHVESVAWVTERKDVLYAFFYLLALWSYLNHLEKLEQIKALKKKSKIKMAYPWGWISATTLFGLLSILSKPMALSLPLVLFLVDWFKQRKIKKQAVIEKMPLVALIGAITLITYVAHARMPGDHFFESVLIWIWTFAFYIRQFLFPIVLAPIYHLPYPIEIFKPQYILSVVIFIGVVVALIRFRANRWWIFGFGFYFLSIFFLLRFDDLKDVNIVADRFMYLPMASFCWLIGKVAEDWLQISKQRREILVVLVIIIGIFCIQTFRHAQIWQKSATLWQHELKYYPREWAALNNLAGALLEQADYKNAQKDYKKLLRNISPGADIELSGRFKTSQQKMQHIEDLYKKALEARPDYIDSLYNLGLFYNDMGAYPKAVEYFHKAIQIDPKHKDTLASLGNLYRDQNQPEKAIEFYEAAIATDPKNEEIYINVLLSYKKALENDADHILYAQAKDSVLSRLKELVGRHPKTTSFFNLGFVLSELGEDAKAIHAYEKALEINPNHMLSLYNLGNSYKNLGQFNEALKYYERASRHSDAYINIGIIYQKKGDLAKAREFYEKARRADPKNAKAYFNLGFIEESAGRLDAAKPYYQRVVEIDPENAEGWYNLGNVLARLNKNQDALKAYQRVTEINPNHMDAWVNTSVVAYQEGDFKLAAKACDEAVLLGYVAPADYVEALKAYR